MGVFTRFKDIISANLNSMLDRAEDPEKMIRLMISEMEETLVELKSSTASLMADKLKVKREGDWMQSEVRKWSERASLAMDKGREDLAREAIIEKQRFEARMQELDAEVAKFDGLIDQSRSDINRLEEKITAARKKQRLLVQRQNRAQGRMQTEKNIRKAGSSEAILKFEEYEHRIDRMEAAAGLAATAPAKQGESLEEKFARLETDQAVEKELAALKEKKAAQQSSSK